MLRIFSLPKPQNGVEATLLNSVKKYTQLSNLILNIDNDVIIARSKKLIR